MKDIKSFAKLAKSVNSLHSSSVLESNFSDITGHSTNLSQQLLSYYKDKTLKLEKDYQELLIVLDKIKAGCDFSVQLQKEIDIRSEEVSKLQKVVGDLQVHLFREKEENLKLIAENDQLKIEDYKNKKKINLLLMSSGTNEKMFFHLVTNSNKEKCVPANLPSKLQKLKETKLDELLRFKDSEKYHETFKDMDPQNQLLASQLEHHIKISKEQISMLLKEKEISREERKIEKQRLQKEISFLTSKLKEIQDLLCEATEKLIKCQHQYEKEKTIWVEEKEKYVSVINKLNLMDDDEPDFLKYCLKKENCKNGLIGEGKNELIEKEQLASAYQDKIVALETEIQRLRERAQVCRNTFKEKTAKMTAQVSYLKNKYEDLDRRRQLEAEGFRTDIRMLRERLKELEKKLSKSSSGVHSGEQQQLLVSARNTLNRAKQLEKELAKMKYKISALNSNEVPVFLKEFGPVDYINFSPVEPYYFAVTSSVRVQVYSPVTKLVHKNLSRFQKSAYGGSFRNDGKLICAGGEENLVKLFDVSTKTLLRVFHGHIGPVHRCFFTVDNTHIASFSDDKTVNLFDIASETKVVCFKDHNDYVRAGSVSPVSADIILSGGYDGYVKMFDKRSEKVVFSLNHGSPVESVLFLPSGGIFFSAGGTEIKVWDALCGGRLLAQLHYHHKTVTCLCLGSNGSRILSGSLDRHVNIYDVGTFRKVHSLDYPNSILSIGISSNDETVAVGMVDGLISVSRRETQHRITNYEKQQRKFKYASEVKSKDADTFVKETKTGKMPRYDVHLKKFEHTKALNVVLAPFFTNKTPQVTVSVLQELLYRKNLHAAIGGNEPKTVIPLLRFLIKYLGDYRFTRTLIDVTNVFMDVYEDLIPGCGPQVVSLFSKLSRRLSEEIELTESLLTLEGSVQMMLAASAVTSSKLASEVSLKPSENAKDFVVNVN